MPWQPRNSVSKCRDRTVRSATGPSELRPKECGIPPVRMTEVCRSVRRPRTAEQVHHAQRVGHDRQSGNVEEALGQRERRGAGGQGDCGAGLDQTGRCPPDRCLFRLLEHELGLEAGLVAAGWCSGQDRSAVNLFDQAISREGLQVSADGHVRDSELLGEITDPCAAVAADSLEDQRLPMPGKHP